jgi:hypothetical protein
MVTQKLMTDVVTDYTTTLYEQKTIVGKNLLYQCGSFEGEIKGRLFPYKTITNLGATIYALA